jgi:hypothetical protein
MNPISCTSYLQHPEIKPRNNGIHKHTEYIPDYDPDSHSPATKSRARDLLEESPKDVLDGEKIHKREGVDACRLALYRSRISFPSCLKDVQRLQTKLEASKELKRRQEPRNVMQFYR